MLSRLSIRNILLIEEIDLEFHSGFNALTGETGAGKSILLDCLGFVLGWRGKSDIVRAGADRGEVTAIFSFDPQSAVADALEDAGIEVEDELVLRRQSFPDGRKRGFINDQPVSAELMRKIGAHLVEIHGQHDDKGLLDEKTHRDWIDRFAKLDLAEMRQAYSDYMAAKDELDAFDEAAALAQRDAEYILHAAKELAALDIEEGEEAALDQERRNLRQGEQMAQEVAEIGQLFSRDGVIGQFSDLFARVQRLDDKLEGGAQGVVALLDAAYDQLGEAEVEFEALARQMRHDPLRLEQVEERLFLIRQLARKYNVAPDELGKTAESFANQAEALETTDGKRAALLDRYESAKARALAEASALRAARKAAAKALEAAITKELAPLKMERARFRVEFEDANLSTSGMDRVRFAAQTNPGAPFGSISKIASGGELSRFLLAIHLCILSERADACMIFDEIDRGVGGNTANAIAERLARLSTGVQLLIVTHSAPLAAAAKRQFEVAKQQSQDDTLTTVIELDERQRLDEIARMIAGDIATDEARAAAQKLIERSHETPA